MVTGANEIRPGGQFLVAWVVCLALGLAGAGRASAAPTIQPLIPELEKIRGLQFVHPVETREIRRGDLHAILEREVAADLDLPPAEYVEVLRDLGLIRDRKNPIDALIDLYQKQVLAFYDPTEHVYYSIADPTGPIAGNPMLERAVALHELMHALQDQVFHAGEKLEKVRGNWDAEMAYHALIEGEATLVMLASLAESTGSNIDQIVGNDALMASFDQLASADLGVSGAPRYFVDSLKFPYVAGLRFAIEAYRHGGWKGLDRADRNPPKTTAEIIDPSLYFRRHEQEGSNPFLPRGLRKDGASVFETSLGEFHWRFLLGKHEIHGWDGDRVTVFEGADSDEVFVESEWRSACDAAEFAGAYSGFLASRARDVRIESSGRFVDVVYTMPRGDAEPDAGQVMP